MSPSITLILSHNAPRSHLGLQLHSMSAALAGAVLGQPLLCGLLESMLYQRGAIPLLRPQIASPYPLGGTLRRGVRGFPLVQPVLQQEPAAGQ